MRVRLTRKLAQRVDGIDLSNYREGDVLDISKREAQLLMAEGWAVRAGSRSDHEVRRRSAASVRAEADNMQRANRRRLQRVQRALDHQRFEAHADRRSEDRIRDELQDERARIVNAPPSQPNHRTTRNGKDNRS